MNDPAGDRKRRLPYSAIAVGAVVAVAVAGVVVHLTARRHASDLVGIAVLDAALEKAGGWVPLPIPDPKVRPGTVIHVSAAGGLRFVGDLRECRVSERALSPVAGSIGTLALDSEVAYDARALVALPGVKPGTEFDLVKRTGLTIGEFGADGLDLLRLQAFLTDPANQVPEFCLQWLEQDDIYLVNEAFRIDKARYSLRDENGVKLSLPLDKLAKVVKLDASAGARWNAAGELEISKPVYIAVRRARKLDGRFETLSDPRDDEQYADALLREIVVKGRSGDVR